MDEMGINRVLSEMRALQARSTLPAAAPAPVAGTEAPQRSGFVDAMRDAVRGVNDRQADAARAASGDRRQTNRASSRRSATT